MKTIQLEQEFGCPASAVWEVISDVSRSDWVPMVDSITLEDDVRSFEMKGIGTVRERILEVDHEALCLRYSAISTPVKMEHHLAIIRVVSDGDSCRLQWTVEIEPDLFAIAVHGGMQRSIEELRKVLGLEN